MLKYLFAMPVAIIGMAVSRNAAAAACDSAIGNGSLVNSDCVYTKCILTGDVLSNGKCYCKKQQCGYSGGYVNMFKIRTLATCC